MAALPQLCQSLVAADSGRCGEIIDRNARPDQFDDIAAFNIAGIAGIDRSEIHADAADKGTALALRDHKAARAIFGFGETSRNAITETGADRADAPWSTHHPALILADAFHPVREYAPE